MKAGSQVTTAVGRRMLPNLGTKQKGTLYTLTVGVKSVQLLWFWQAYIITEKQSESLHVLIRLRWARNKCSASCLSLLMEQSIGSFLHPKPPGQHQDTESWDSIMLQENRKKGCCSTPWMKSECSLGNGHSGNCSIWIQFPNLVSIDSNSKSITKKHFWFFTWNAPSQLIWVS